MNICQKFATILAKGAGMTYAQATKKYPRGCEDKTVYKNDYETHRAHCVHCARAEVITDQEEFTKIQEELR